MKQTRFEFLPVIFRLMLLASLIALIAGHNLQTSQARDLDEIKRSGEFRICMVPLTPVYSVITDLACRENCAFSGPIYREVRAFAAGMGSDIRPVFHRVDWDEQFFDDTGKTDLEAVYTPGLLSCEKCDVYPSHLTKNDWRAKKLDFAILFSSRMMVIVNQGNPNHIQSSSSLAGKIAAVEKNTSFHTWLLAQNAQAFSRSPVIIHLMSMEASLEAVETGKADFTLVDADIALWNTRHKFKRAVVAFPVGPIEEIGWAFRKEDRQLKEAVQAFFNAQSQDETSELNRIWKEEFGVTLVQMNALIRATR